MPAGSVTAIGEDRPAPMTTREQPGFADMRCTRSKVDRAMLLNSHVVRRPNDLTSCEPNPYHLAHKQA
jgi:hypothetical protein